MDAILFDLDGTLWNAMEPIFRAWSEALACSAQPHRTLTQEFLHGCMGKTPEELAEMTFPGVEPAICAAEMKKIFAHENEVVESAGGVLYPGVPETLEQLSKKYALFIVSNAADGYVQAFLRWSQLRCFRDFEAAGRTGLEKGPNIRLVMERNGVDRAIYVGDTQSDADAAAFAGIPLIFTSYGFGSVLKPRWQIQSFSELPAVAASILA